MTYKTHLSSTTTRNTLVHFFIHNNLYELTVKAIFICFFF